MATLQDLVERLILFKEDLTNRLPYEDAKVLDSIISKRTDKFAALLRTKED